MDKSLTRKQKQQHPRRESQLWQAGCEQGGSARAGSLWIDVCDPWQLGGEADSHEFLEYELTHQRSFVIRRGKDRALSAEDRQRCDQTCQKLFAHTCDLPELGRRNVEVSRPVELPVAGQHPCPHAPPVCVWRQRP